MQSLDDQDLDFDLDFGKPLVSQPPKRRSFPVGKILKILGVVALGGGLGTGGYFVSSLDTRDVIGVFDLVDTQPHLTFSMPSRNINGAVPSPAAAGDGGGLLTPPLVPPAGGASPSVLTPPSSPSPSSASPPASGGEPASPVPAASAPPTPPAVVAPPGSAPPGSAPPVAAAPVAPVQQAALPPAAHPAPPPPLAPSAVIIPSQPIPRGSDQAPTYATLPESLAPRKALSSSPVDGLTQQSPQGVLPIISADGRQPWKVHAMPFDAPATKPRLAVLVTGLGLDRDATDAAIAKLPPEVTLVFSPYAPTLDKWLKKARDKGHEVMLALPTEPMGYPANDPGPLGLLSGNTPAINAQQLEKSLARMINYVGVLVPDGPFAQSDQLGGIFSACKQRGLLYVGPRLPVEAAPPAAVVTTEIGVDLFRDAIDAQLDRAAATAIQNGSAVVVVSPKPASFARLLAWIEKVNSLGMAVSPIASVVKHGGK